MEGGERGMEGEGGRQGNQQARKCAICSHIGSICFLLLSGETLRPQAGQTAMVRLSKLSSSKCKQCIFRTKEVKVVFVHHHHHYHHDHTNHSSTTRHSTTTKQSTTKHSTTKQSTTKQSSKQTKQTVSTEQRVLHHYAGISTSYHRVRVPTRTREKSHLNWQGLTSQQRSDWIAHREEQKNEHKAAALEEHLSLMHMGAN